VKKAFSMLELVFVIVIIGILAAVAIPKLWVTRDDAIVAKIRSDVSNIRSAISSKYGKYVLEGNDSCPDLEGSDDNRLFEGVMAYPIKKNSGSIKWDGNGTDYNITWNDKVLKFHYYNSPADNCKFECNNTDACDVMGE